MSFRLIKDSSPTFLNSKSQLLPTFTSTNPPPNLIAGIGGGIGYDITTKRVYYNNGVMWVPLQAAGGGSGSVLSYSLVLETDLNVLPATNPVLAGLAMPTPFHDETGSWNLSTGVYTASAAQTFSMQVNLTWGPGSNLGNRTTNIIYKPAVGLPQLVKNVTTQANPSSNVPTNQTVTTFIEMLPGDTAWVEVSHTASGVLQVAGLSPTPQTTICGVRINSS